MGGEAHDVCRDRIAHVHEHVFTRDTIAPRFEAFALVASRPAAAVGIHWLGPEPRAHGTRASFES